MVKGTRKAQPLCNCGCGNKVPPKLDGEGRHKGYNKYVEGHKSPPTEKFRAAWNKTRFMRYKPIGTRRQTPSGYWFIKVDNSRRWIYEHRWVMQQMVGRKLHPKEHVHHKDGNKSNNSPENLELLFATEHAAIAGKDNVTKGLGIWKYPVCKDCGWRHPPHS